MIIGLNSAAFAKENETREEDCFDNLTSFSELYLETVFSKCLYACYRKLEECPDPEQAPSAICRKLVSIIKMSAATKFNDCIYNQQLDLMQQYDKISPEKK
jgi:hypothetical protein